MAAQVHKHIAIPCRPAARSIKPVAAHIHKQQRARQLVAAQCSPATQAVEASATAAAAAKYGWTLPEAGTSPQAAAENVPDRKRRLIKELPVAAINRPLGGVRSNDNEKVEALMASISEIGLQEPIDVLEVDGKYYGFSGCHRFEAHQRLGRETILCRVRKANQAVLMAHMR